MGTAWAGLPLEAERLLRLVRRMQPGEFARIFRRGLADPELLRVIGALPAEQRGVLAAQARRSPCSPPAASNGQGRRADRGLATAIRTARQQVRISQWQLARLVGVRQAAVSQ
jgi:hypothetical protein